MIHGEYGALAHVSQCHGETPSQREFWWFLALNLAFLGNDIEDIRTVFEEFGDEGIYISQHFIYCDSV